MKYGFYDEKLTEEECASISNEDIYDIPHVYETIAECIRLNGDIPNIQESFDEGLEEYESLLIDIEDSYFVKTVLGKEFVVFVNTGRVAEIELY